MADPVYVNLSGKKVLFSSLPEGTQKALRNIQAGKTASGTKSLITVQKTLGERREKGTLVKAPAFGGSLSQAFEIMNSASFTPRERMKAREQLIKAGVKGTSLHLGAPTPEVLAQLQKSASQQNFQEKRTDIENQIKLLEKKGVVSGNSSTRPELSKQVAERTFAIQQAYTQQKTDQVRALLDSPEFLQLKQSGDASGASTFTKYQDLLNQKGISAPRFEMEIVNELAQADIQGDVVTAQNIQRILERAGFTDSVSVASDGAGTTQLTGLEDNPVLSGFQDQLNLVITGAPSLSAFGDGTFGDPISDLRFTDLPELGGADVDTEDTAGSGILGLLTNPFVLLGIGAIVLFIILLGGKA